MVAVPFSEGEDDFLHEPIPIPIISPKTNHRTHNHIYLGNTRETVDTLLLTGNNKERWTTALSNKLGRLSKEY